MSETTQLLVIAAVCCFVLGAITWEGVCEWLDRREQRARTQGWTQ